MVTKQGLQESLTTQSTNIKKQLNESIPKIRSEIIDALAFENKNLNDKIVVLQKKLIAMEKKLEINLQYQRCSGIVICGIPMPINYIELEGIVI